MNVVPLFHRIEVLPKSEDRDRYESSAVEGDAALAISSLAFVSYRTLVQVSPLVCKDQYHA